MRSTCVALIVLATIIVAAKPASAARPVVKREKADYVLTGPVQALYIQESKGYRSYIVEIKVEEVEKGEGLKKGDTFRAYCYQRKEGKGGLEFDTDGHKVVPKQGQRVKMFVMHGGGHNEGCYPDWIDVLADAKK